MKLLIVHNSYQQPGGEDVAFAQECQLLKSHGHKVLTYQRSNREIEAMTRLERLALTKNIVWGENSRRYIRELLRSERPDLVHVHNTFMMVSPSVYQACQEMRVPVIQTLHNFRLLCPAFSLFRDGHVCEECPTSGLAFCEAWLLSQLARDDGERRTDASSSPRVADLEQLGRHLCRA